MSTSGVYFNKTKFMLKSRDDQPDDEVVDTFCLDGNYEIKCGYPNSAALAENVDYDDFERAVNCKAVFFYGNILYKSDEPKIWEYIDLMIETTYKTELSVPVDTSVETNIKLEGGTICPSIHTLFSYDGKLFTLYGRYIYGYDAPHVKFSLCDKPQKYYSSSDENDDDAESEEDYVGSDGSFESYDFKRKKYERDPNGEYYGDWKLKPPIINSEEIVLPIVANNIRCKKLEDYLDDYVYSFAIVDDKTKVLQAFALYR
ncbi:unnamed protein product [Diatraea saccharalis]|uniref:Uncharacterized protein n=1 Tax=Diatraea saccharalis TaxID=40085 RepID=A0A9N9WH91_9NEOP|nr:unnamed protein product [Diatraea saccharalis]